MLDVYKSTDEGFESVNVIEDGVWISLTDPTEEEIDFVLTAIEVERDFLTASLDEEERPHIEADKDRGNILIVADIPFLEENGNSRKYVTYPLGIIYTPMAVITVCLKENLIMSEFSTGAVKTFYTYKKSRFILQILYKISVLYLQYLKQIDRLSSTIESELHRSMKNKELIQLMDLEKSLVYFSTALKANEIVLERLQRHDFLQKYEEDQELLSDTIIENKQAIEMAKIYSDILAGTMDAFASIISNNLNIVMQFLTSVTIIMAIPAMISGFFGMNVPIPFEANAYGFAYVMAITVLICAAAAFFMAKKKLF